MSARRAALLVALLACAHRKESLPDVKAEGGVEVEDAVDGVRYQLPPSDDVWQISHDGKARLAGGVEAEISYFPLAKTASGKDCREQARAHAGKEGDGDAPREQATTDDPATFSFTVGAAAAPERDRWAFYPRGADCVVLRVKGAKDDAFAEKTFAFAARTLRVLPLPAERQREWDLLAGMDFLERHEPAAALDRFEALTRREPALAKAHFGALMAGFDIGPQAYARALPHGILALKSERELSAEQRQLGLRAVGVMQLEENHLREAADTLAELVVRAPDLAEGHYNYACALARLGDSGGALDHLKRAVQLDADLARNAKGDDDLKSLRGQPGFDQLTR